MKILLIEDDPDDRAMIAREVRQGFPDAALVELDSAAVDRALARNDPCVVLTAYALDGVSGLDMLDRVKATDPDCPVIMISSVAGEDVAVEAMRHGVDDYLLKTQGQLRRLNPAIHTALARRHARTMFRDAENQYRGLFDLVPASLCYCLADGVILDTNRSFRDLLGAKDDLRGAALSSFLVHPGPFAAVIRKAESRTGVEVRLRRAGDEVGWAVLRVRRVRFDGVQHLECAFTDITESKRSQERTEALLREKNALIEELYHRVNNNLQIVMSFVQQLFRETRDPTAKTGLQDLSARIYSLSLVQDQLYRNQNFAEVDLRQYLEDLCAARLRGTRIATTLELADLRLPIAQAIPVGLIANELLLNAVQHAFDETIAAPRIALSLRRLGGGRVLLAVRDNGRGLPRDEAPKGYGFRLIDLLARQIGARLSVDRQAGTTVSIEFPAAD